MAFDEVLADRVRIILADVSTVSERKMFGGLAFMVGGHMACGVLRNELIVRVDPSSDALTRPFARPFDFTGRPTRGIVFVAPDGLVTADDLGSWVDRGLASVAQRQE